MTVLVIEALRKEACQKGWISVWCSNTVFNSKWTANCMLCQECWSANKPTNIAAFCISFVLWLCPYSNFVNSHSDSCSKVLKFTTMSHFITLFWYSFDIHSCFKIMENIIFFSWYTITTNISLSTAWHMLSAIRRYAKDCIVWTKCCSQLWDSWKWSYVYWRNWGTFDNLVLFCFVYLFNIDVYSCMHFAIKTVEML